MLVIEKNMNEKDFNNCGIQYLNVLSEFVAHYENIKEASEKTGLPERYIILSIKNGISIEDMLFFVDG